MAAALIAFGMLVVLVACAGGGGTRSGGIFGVIPAIIPVGTASPISSPIVTPTPSPTPAGTNPIVVENAKPGDTEWAIRTHAGYGELDGYAGEVSVAAGEPVDVHVSSNGTHTMRWRAYRIGWYGGAGARLVATGGPLTIGAQAQPVPDPMTGLIECDWPVTFTIGTDGWTTGAYVVKLLREDGKESYVTFVVRDDGRRKAAVVQLPVSTWQAYNTWGGEGLYASHAVSLSGDHAKVVSFDRPYVEGAGSGQLFRYDAFFIRWAESMGYDLVYTTSVDVSTRDVLSGQRLFLSIGHDEYWTRAERDAVTAAIDAGTSAAFFSANDAYWQIRLEPSGRGRPARREVCYKNEAPAEDPLAGTDLITVRWRDPQLSAPENGLLGIMYTDYQIVDAPFVVAGADNWFWAGTGVSNGDTIPLVVGYETDAVFDNGFTPAGLVVLGTSPVLSHTGGDFIQNAAVYAAPSGAFVVAVGTIQWSWGLASPGFANLAAQRATQNVFARAGLVATPGGDDFHALHPPTATLTNAASSVSTLAGARRADGLVDGSPSSARFRKPTAIAADADGNLFVADTGNSRIRMIAAGSHQVSTIASGLAHPAGIAVASNGDVVVADTGNHRIVRLSRASGWSMSVIAGSPSGNPGLSNGTGTSARFYDPMGIAIVGANLFIADSHNHAIRLIDGSGAVVTVVGGTGNGSNDGPGAAAKLDYPTAVVAADGSSLYVTDAGNRLIRRVVLSDGNYATSLLAGAPNDEFPKGGFADGPASTALFMPQGQIAVAGGALYLADTANGRIRRIANGSVSTFAGSGVMNGGDGDGAHASLGLPVGIARLPDGSFAVVDQSDSVVLRVVP